MRRGKTAEGKRKVIEKGGFETNQAAFDAGVIAYNDWKHGNIGITSENISLKNFIRNWLDNVVALNVKANSLQRYENSLKKQILPSLGDIPVKKLTPAILDKWLRELQQAGYSKNTLIQSHSLIHNALDYAVYPAEIISSNPANYINIPKKAPTNIIKRHIISREKFNELLTKYPFGTPYYMPILTLYYTGCRISELLGLTWQDINFGRKTLTIQRQITYIAREGLYFSTPKTESSQREIFVDDFLLNELSRWKNQQADNETIAGDSYIYIYRAANNKIIRQSKRFPADAERVPMVCTVQNGNLLLKQNLEKILTAEGLNAHSFRHTHATILIEHGATPKGIAGRLGHSKIDITQNLYTHNTEKLREDTSKIFSETMQTKS